jgi:glutamine synthetase
VPDRGWASEFDSAAFEVNLRYKEVIPAADECFLFRLLVKEIAIKQGKLATFMGRPFNDRGGSGLHLNISFRRKDGSNALHDPNAPDGLAPMVKECVAGMLAHHEGISAIAAPHANAYKRLQPDMLNGYWANWGYDDRTVCIRIPRLRRGHPVPDGRRRGEPVPGRRGGAARRAVRDGASMSPSSPRSQEPPVRRRVPSTLEAALAAFEADDELCSAFGPWLVETFTKLKRAEWERYAKTVGDATSTEVTPCELVYYLPFF